MRRVGFTIVLVVAVAVLIHFKDHWLALLPTAEGPAPTSSASKGNAPKTASKSTNIALATAPAKTPPQSISAATNAHENPAQPAKPAKPGSGGPTIGTIAGTSRTTPTVLIPPANADQPQALEAEAKEYVERLSQPDPIPLKVGQANHFVSQDQVLSLLPDNLVESTSVTALTSDPALSPDTPITLVKRIEQIELATPQRLIADANGDLDQTVQVFRDQGVHDVQVRHILAQLAKNPDIAVSVIRQVDYLELTTPGELAADTTLDASEPIEVIKKSYALEAASVADLIRAKRAVAPDSVFYVRTVRPGDAQGLWGIVHDGLIENFGRGMAIRRGKDVETYTVNIPQTADELEGNKHSSFLGKLIFRKTQDSYVYNFKENRMGRNPDRIFPGQEIVIIDFRPEELIAIYRHFVEQQG